MIIVFTVNRTPEQMEHNFTRLLLLALKEEMSTIYHAIQSEQLDLTKEPVNLLFLALSQMYTHSLIVLLIS
jgi:hypothetical protein